MAGGTATVNQTHYQFQVDEADNNTAELLGTEDVSNNSLDLDQTYYIRIHVTNTGGMSANNVAYRLEYNVDGAGWNDVTVTSGNVRALGGPDADGDPCSTELLTNDGGTFVSSGLYEESGITPNITLNPSEEMELCYSFQFRSAELSAGGENIDLRITDDGAIIDNYDVTIEATMPSVDNNISTLPATALTLTNNAPQAVTTEKHIAVLPATALTLTNNAPQTVVTEHNTALLPATNLTITGFVPTVVSTDSNFAVLPPTTITLTNNAPSVESTEHHLSQPPDAALVITANAPQTVITEHNIAVLPATVLTLTPNNPQTVVTAGEVALLPATALTLTANVPQAVTTENNVSQPPSAALSLTTAVPTVVATENNVSELPSVTLTLTANAPQAVTTEGEIAQLPATALTLTANVPQAVTTEHNIAILPSASLTITANAPQATTTESGVGTDVYPSPIRKPWSTKPPSNTRINRAHPMAKDLIFFCAMDNAGEQIDLMQDRRGIVVDSGSDNLTFLKPTQRGLLTEIQGSANLHEAGFDFGNTGGSGDYEPTELTIIAQVFHNDWLDANGQRIISKRAGVTSNDDYSIQTGANANELFYRVNGLDDTINIGQSLENQWLDVALTVNSSNQDSYLWRIATNERDTSLGNLGATVDQSTGNLCVGHRNGENRVWDGDINYVAIWRVKKDEDFLENFRRNPWQIFEPRRLLPPLMMAQTLSNTATLPSVTLTLTPNAPQVTTTETAPEQTDVYPLHTRPWIAKPPFNTPINRSHPFAQDLIFFCACDSAGQQVDLINDRVAAIVNEGGGQLTPAKPTRYGAVFDVEHSFNDSAGADFGDTGGSGVYEPTELTIIARARPEDEAHSAGSRVISKRTTSTGSDDYSIYYDSSRTNWRMRINGTDHVLARASGNYDGVLCDLALTVDTTEQLSFVWEPENGDVRVFDPGTGGATVNTGTGHLTLGHRWAENRTFDGEIHYVAIWKRKKTQEFINEFRRNPWQIFQPRKMPLLINSTVLTQTDVYPLRRVPQRSFPQQRPIEFDRNNFFGQHCLGCVLPGLDEFFGDTNGVAGVVHTIGMPGFDYVPIRWGTGLPTLAKTTDFYARGIGHAKAAAFRPGSNEDQRIGLERVSSDFGVAFPDPNNLCVISITRPIGDGRAGGTGDPRHWTQDIGEATADHDLMIGQQGGVNARCRIRLSTQVHTMITSGTAIQNDALNLICGGVAPAGTASEPFVALVREDGGTNWDGDTGETTGYAPRSASSMAIGGSAEVIGNAFNGDIIGIWFFDISLFNQGDPNFNLLKLFFEDPWQIFPPQRRPLLIQSAGAAPPAEENNISQLPATALTLTANAPQVVATENNFAVLPATALTLTANAPTAVATENNFAVLPATALTLTPNNPQVVATENNIAQLPATALTLTANNPQAVTTEKNIAVLPATALTLTANNPQAIVTEGETSLLPATALTLTANAPTAVSTDNNIAQLPATALTLTANAPQSVVTENNISQLPATALTLTANNPQAIVTEGETALLPATALTLTANVPTAVATENNFAELPATALTLTANNPQSVTTENNVAQLPATALTLTPNNPQTIVTEGEFSLLPATALTLTANAPQTVVSENNFAVLPATALTLTPNNPQAVTSEENFATLPATVLTLTPNNPQAISTEGETALLPATALTITPFAPQAVTTEKNIAVLPATVLTITPNAPTVEVFDPNTVQLPTVTLTLTANAPQTVVSENHISQLATGVLTITPNNPQAVTSEGQIAQLATASILLTAFGPTVFVPNNELDRTDDPDVIDMSDPHEFILIRS